MDRLVLSGSVQERHFIYPSFCDDSSMMRCRPIKHGEAVSEKNKTQGSAIGSRVLVFSIHNNTDRIRFVRSS